MANKTDKNVVGLYNGDALDEITIKLHSNSGPEVEFTVWEDDDHMYHVFADTDDSTEDFLSEYYPEDLESYRKMVECIPTASWRYLRSINRFIAQYTYNSIRPLIEDESCWLTLNEEELDKD